MTIQFDFDDLAPIEIPVKIRGKKYVLREASAEAARKWRNAMLSGTKLTDGKVTGIGNVADSESLLVSLCLFPLGVNGEAEAKPVPHQVILQWPNRIVKPLFNEAKRISDLDEKDESKPDTEESLTAEMASLQVRLDKLRAGRGLNQEAGGEANPTDG